MSIYPDWYEPEPYHFNEPDDFEYPITCKYCGEKNLKWIELIGNGNRKWVLIYRTRKIHKCKGK